MRSKILCCFFIVPGDSYRPIPIERSEMKIRFGTLLMRVYGHNISIKVSSTDTLWSPEICLSFCKLAIESAFAYELTVSSEPEKHRSKCFQILGNLIWDSTLVNF
ncbi:hypothetical protein LINPERPRIM_LOCUS5473, partial [Linum perenne]